MVSAGQVEQPQLFGHNERAIKNPAQGGVGKAIMRLPYPGDRRVRPDHKPIPQSLGVIVGDPFLAFRL